jgi:hypothetical protein
MTIKALYPTVRPTLNLDFAKTKALDPRVTFTRASTGTFAGSNGLIQTAASGAARFDHNPETGESLGLLVEEARTNNFQYSIDFSQSYWTKPSITSNSIIAPDGTTTGSTLTATGSNTNQMLHIFLNPGSTQHSCSIFAKAGTSNWLAISNANDYQFYNLSNGTLGNTSNNSGSPVGIEDYGNGWYRCWIAPVTTASNVGWKYRVVSADNSLSATTGDSIYLWGAQLEAGAFPTSYIPTVASTVTRAADVATVSNTGSSIFPTSAFTTVNSPYGTAGGGSTVKLVGPTVKRTAVYASDLTQAQINALAEVNDNFWRWRVLGTSFALPSFTANGSVTVDWGDGVVETLTTAVHTFTNGGGYHDIGFRFNSGTFFKPNINNNATYKTRVIATGPAPASMKVDANLGFYGCSALRSFDATVDVTGGTNFSYAWNNCNSLTSFPLIDTAAGNNFTRAWFDCTSLTSFPLIDTAAGTNFTNAWTNCSSLTSFPLINTAAGTNFLSTWYGCSSLTSFPLINTAAGTTFQNTWQGCSSLTSFPLINTAAGTIFYRAWWGCSSLTSFPLIDTAAGTSFYQAWKSCSSLTSFPLINTAAGTNFESAWLGCTSLTSFPLIDTSSGTNLKDAWWGCTSLTSFPLIDTAAGTNFQSTWFNCNSLTSFPLINTAAGTNFQSAWNGCTSLTSFPLIDTSSGTNFTNAWSNCSSLTSFPLINTAAGTNFSLTWFGCSSLTSFPLINTAAGTNFYQTWHGCSSLTSFPLIDTSSSTNFRDAWRYCNSLTDFPANFFDSWAGTPVANCFFNAWDVCPALTATSVENILNSIDTSGQSAPASGVDITIDYNASSGTPSVATAITNLQSRGWTITLNGVLQ